MLNTRIGVLGSGNVGKALDYGFAQHGWDVLVGTRNPEDLRDWQGEISSRTVERYINRTEHV
ncbi:NAD(P)-binding domain-containing protein [Haladaptatus sp. CMAA 1911]|uniref:NAD(P)-binding domain-containing protein n=1 Tax=unclassified Haladaptatus TaxID=2622732 RepID=UPI003754D6D0